MQDGATFTVILMDDEEWRRLADVLRVDVGELYARTALDLKGREDLKSLLESDCPAFSALLFLSVLSKTAIDVETNLPPSDCPKASGNWPTSRRSIWSVAEI